MVDAELLSGHNPLKIMSAEQISYYATAGAFVTIVLLWFGFAATFLTRSRHGASTDAAKAPRSWVGLILQSVAYMPVWAIRRMPVFSPLIDGYYVLNIVLQIVAVVLGGVSVWLVMAAVQELGRQWSLEARLIEGHKLVTTGVYGLVRHPIYTAMLGMLIATGIAFGRWYVLLVSVAVFVVGTRIRTVFEERLLHEAFGQEFEDFRAKVPGLIPFVKI